jgi:hypothetical protein
VRAQNRRSFGAWWSLVNGCKAVAAAFCRRRTLAGLQSMVQEWRRYASSVVAQRTAHLLRQHTIATAMGRRVICVWALRQWREAVEELSSERARGQYRKELLNTAAAALRSLHRQSPLDACALPAASGSACEVESDGIARAVKE